MCTYNKQLKDLFFICCFRKLPGLQSGNITACVLFIKRRSESSTEKLVLNRSVGDNFPLNTNLFIGMYCQGILYGQALSNLFNNRAIHLMPGNILNCGFSEDQADLQEINFEGCHT